MYLPPGHLARAHVSVGVAAVVFAAGYLLLGSDATDSEIQVLGGISFLTAMVVLVELLARLDRRR